MLDVTTTKIVILTLCIFSGLTARNIWQPQDQLPTIETFWENNQEKTYQLSHSRLEKWAIFDRYSATEVKKHQLPDQITWEHGAITVNEITKLCQHLLHELNARKNTRVHFSHFTVLKDADFNYKEKYGTIILKFKDYPLVCKLFCETPQSFVRPFSKGIVPSFLFSMGGGINRFLAGFTRIPNLETIQDILAHEPAWKNKIRLPRKWYWLPQENPYFVIKGYNFSQNPNEVFQICVPGTYAIISDYIPCAKKFSLKSHEERTTAIQLQALFKNKIDPHICNFFFDETGKIAIIDTEHFASIMGLQEDDFFHNYGHLVIGLGNRFIKRTLFQNKEERRKATQNPTPESLRIHH